MLFRMIKGALLRQWGKMLLIALTIALGASLATSMINVMLDVGDKVNEELKAFFLERGLKLVDFKIEFGKTADGKIILADEISPDTCRLWDVETNKKMDKDRFRRDLGDVEETYQEVFERIEK